MIKKKKRRPVPPTGVGGGGGVSKAVVNVMGYPVSRVWLSRLFIAMLCFVVYVNSLWCDFVFDDVSAIKDNKDLRPSSPWSNILKHDFWGTDMRKEHSHKSYRPFTVLSFRLNYMVHQLEPMGYHAINLFLHAIVSLLYHKLVHDLISVVIIASSSRSSSSTSTPSASSVAFLSAVLFAVHPVHTEAVTGVVGRAELISSIFFILAVLQYKHGASSDSKTSKLSLVSSLVLVPAFVAFAMFSKEQGITVLGVCFVYEVIVVQNLDDRLQQLLFKVNNNNSSVKIKSGSLNFGAFFSRIGVLAVTGVTLLYVRFQVMGSNLPVFTNFDNPASYEDPPTKQLTWSYLVAVNLRLLLAPVDLCCDWTMKTVALVRHWCDPRNLATLCTALLLGWLGIWALLGAAITQPRRRLVLMSLALMGLPFLPASNLFFPVGFVVAERVLYLPSMGFCLLVALGYDQLVKSAETRQRHLAAIFLKFCFVSLISFHGAKTIVRNTDWTNELSIFTSGIVVNPENAKLWNNVGHAHEASDDFQKALSYFEKAAAVQPDDLGAHINVGRTHNNLGNYHKAEAAYLKAKAMMPQPKAGGQPYTARIAPQHLSVFLNLGNLIARDAGRLEEADGLYRRAISMRSDYIQAYINRGDVLIKMGKHGEAAEVYRQALTYEPDNPDLHYNLGVVHIEMGRPAEALAHFDRALVIDPDHLQALTNSAVLMQETGRADLRPIAYQRLHKVLDQSSEKAAGKSSASKRGPLSGLDRIYFNLGMLAMDDEDLVKAEHWFKTAVKAKAGFRSALFNLALLLNDLKRPLEALPFLQDLLAHFPEHVKGLILLGDIYTNRVKDLKAAESCYRRIVEIDPSHVQGKHNLCVVMVEQGRLTEAHRCLKEAQVLAPNEAYIAKHLQIVETRIRMTMTTTTTTATTTSDTDATTAVPTPS